MRLALVDAFTTRPGAGNRAGVCLDGDEVDEPGRLAAAAAVAASETAFVVRGDQDVTLRYYTPATEVPFCGHATVATLHRLWEVGRLAPGAYRLGTRAGVLEVRLEAEDGGVRIWLTTPQYPLAPSPVSVEALAAALRADRGALAVDLPIQQAGPKLYVPVTTRAALHALAPDWDAVLALQGNGVQGIYAFTRDVAEAGSAVQGRFFTPAVGIREDPVTGAASGPMAAYLVAHGLLGVPSRGQLEQGDAMGKPGRVAVTVDGAGEIRIGGRAVTVLVGETL